MKKLGSMKLPQGIEQIAETTESTEEAASALKEALTKGEASNAWSAHNAFIKKKPDTANKTKYMIRSRVPKFMNISDSYHQSSILDKRDKWESEIAILQRFPRKELDLHLASGRIRTW